ncbi:DUF5776 domain-containing protein [Lactobacillus helveticus]|uniref:DUF4430 domain-containing protein n=1 Tax=Lactobacillus helveticus TaxID=1587 RepID=A0A3Q8SU64_LACHE|nr:DUF5776 domain-containing protein [Lactobacillus helveticus]AFR22764.1 hypothetical protein R0052_10235 [Lactobacillus helveticus R0052]AZK91447.1 hypothetical protein LH5_01205 [Lactobacillus helveticus]MCJ2190851.1 DUF5776 domain-containing protein [Lactobacillus helveticus]MED7628842.1 DUF4430 domain-containing protein [Lactobacillus helveticus]PTS34169.1 DUF4430 domain-containing protein [Lactobacillus helveticus]
MKRKQFLYWFSIVLGIFLIFFSGGNSSRADAASDFSSAISTGLTEIAQQGSQIDSGADTASDVDSAISAGLAEIIAQKGSKIDAWDATCLVFGDRITDLQAQYAYKSILNNNDFLSGGSQGLNGISDVSAVNGLVAIGKDPTNVNGKNLVANIVKDANNPASDYSIVNDLEALSTGSYGQASETARTSLTKKLIGMQDQKTGLWNGFDKVDYTARAILALSMNTNQPGAADALNTAVKAVSNHFYQENGGFADSSNTMYGAENVYNDVTMTNALASAGVNVYVPLKEKTDYIAPVQRVLDQHPVSAGNSAMLIQQATLAFEQARFTRNGGKGSIFAFNQTDAAKYGEIVSIKAAAITKKWSIINDPQATAAAKSDALNLVDQILATYVSKLSADSTSSAAIADRAAGVTAINHVTVSHAAPATPVTPPTVTNNNVTVVNNPASSSSASSSSAATSTSSSSSVPISTPTVSGKPVKKASHRSIVYALTTVKLYRSSNFTKSNLTKTYKKRARINRPMFLVISQQTNKQGHAIYRVKDMNLGKTGYTLSGSKYFAHAYYSAKVTRIKVIYPKGINEYGKVNLTSKKRHVKKNASLSVRKVVNYGLSNRIQLTNGRYITANKKFILATKIKKSSQNTRPSTPTATTTGTSTSTPPTNSGSTATTTTTTSSKPTATTGTTTTTNNSPSATPTLPVAPTNPVTPSNDAKTITTTISIHADGATIASGSIKVNSGASALDALQAFAQQQGLALTYKGSGATAYVTGINGYNAGPAGTMTGWLYSVNGTEPGSSMGAYTLKDGDSILMTYNK